VATVALIAGPFLRGLFAEDLSWRWIFYINLPIGIVALAAVAAVFRWTVPFMALALVLALAMREKPLSEEMIEAQGKAEVPEY
jgi:MFS family permease